MINMKHINFYSATPLERIATYLIGFRLERARSATAKRQSGSSFNWADHLRKSSGHNLGNAGITK